MHLTFGLLLFFELHTKIYMNKMMFQILLKIHIVNVQFTASEKY